MVDITSKQAFVRDMADYILARASGKGDEDRIIEDRKPSKQFIIGTLAAVKDVKEEEDEEENEGTPTVSEYEGRTTIRAHRMLVSFLAKSSSITRKSKLTITATGYVYYAADAEKDKKTSKKMKVWKRLPYSYTWNTAVPVNSSITQDIDFTEQLKIANSDPQANPHPDRSSWKALLSLTISPYNSEISLVRLGYENNSKEPQGKGKSDDLERTLFHCLLTVTIDGIKTTEFMHEYSYESFPQRYYYDFQSINCHAYWLEKGSKFSTSHYAYFEQDNIRPRNSLPGLDLRFNRLMNPTEVDPCLDSLISVMSKSLASYESKIPKDIDASEFQARQCNRQCTWAERIESINHFRELINRVKTGIAILGRVESARQSFLRTNETFDNYYRSTGINDARWRLFQIIFLLSSLESVVEEKGLDIADVLHVDTGGGKSEAYFALTIFSSFYDRFIGKKDGSTAIVKFPLRMLSIQQLERISSILVHAEVVRRKWESQFKGEPFSLGYYIGNREEFPSTYKENLSNLYERGRLIKPAPTSLILSKCPLCGAVGEVRLYDDDVHRRVVHRCDRCEGEYYIYTSDREIFRWRPTIIVSTVDKWAALSMQRRARSLLGGHGSMCPDGHGFISSGAQCEKNNDNKEAYTCHKIGSGEAASPGPRLSIQDEMHLLREGFGTISSHFEGLIETMVEETSGRKLKHISMSATLSGTERQIDALYRKKTFIIPGRCPDGYGSKGDLFFEKQDGPKRVIYGLKPNIRDNHYASLITLLRYAEFIAKAQKMLIEVPEEFCNKYGLSDKNEAQELLNQYLVPLTYHIKKQDANDMYRLTRQVISDDLDRSCGAVMEGRTISGDSNLETLKEVIDDVRSHVRDYDPQNYQHMEFHPIFATSVVSHGVDLEELNFINFQGLPYSTSEYIQALSRVGRKHLGIVMLWFYPNRVRDESFYRNFVRYHETLDHQVKPIPINRYSRLGLLQTMNALFCAGIMNYLSDKKGQPLIYKRDVMSLTQNDVKDLVNFITEAYGRADLDINIATEVEDRIKQINKSNERESAFFPNVLAKSGEYFYRNPTGMRGIQKQLVLAPYSKEIDILKALRGRD